MVTPFRLFVRTTLKKYGRNLAVLGARNAVKLHSLVCCGPFLAMHEVATDHHSSAPLACLAVDGHNIFGVGLEPCVHILTEWFDDIERGSVMVVKGIAGDCKTLSD